MGNAPCLASRLRGRGLLEAVEGELELLAAILRCGRFAASRMQIARRCAKPRRTAAPDTTHERDGGRQSAWPHPYGRAAAHVEGALAVGLERAGQRTPARISDEFNHSLDSLTTELVRTVAKAA